MTIPLPLVGTLLGLSLLIFFGGGSSSSSSSSQERPGAPPPPGHPREVPPRPRRPHSGRRPMAEPAPAGIDEDELRDFEPGFEETRERVPRGKPEEPEEEIPRVEPEPPAFEGWTLDRACGVLGVAPDVSYDDLRSAWRAKARATHPDATGGDPTGQKFIEVQQAVEYILYHKFGRQRFGMFAL